jgi:hypothetical protein
MNLVDGHLDKVSNVEYKLGFYGQALQIAFQQGGWNARCRRTAHYYVWRNPTVDFERVDMG